MKRTETHACDYKRNKKSRGHKPPAFIFRALQKERPGTQGKNMIDILYHQKQKKQERKRPEPKPRSLTFDRITRQSDKLRALQNITRRAAERPAKTKDRPDLRFINRLLPLLVMLDHTHAHAGLSSQLAL